MATLEELKPQYEQAVSKHAKLMTEAFKDLVLSPEEEKKLTRLATEINMLGRAIDNMTKVRKMSISVRKTGSKFWSVINKQANDSRNLYKKERKEAGFVNAMQSHYNNAIEHYTDVGRVAKLGKQIAEEIAGMLVAGYFDPAKIGNLITVIAATSAKVTAKGSKNVLSIYLSYTSGLSSKVSGIISIQEAKILKGTVNSFYQTLYKEYQDSAILLEKGNRYRKNIESIEAAARQFQSHIKSLAVDVLKNGLKILGVKHADKIASLFKVLLDSSQEIVGERLILKGQSVTPSQAFDIVVTKSIAHIINGKITKIADKLTKRFQADAELGFIKTQTGNGVGWVKDAVNIMFAKGTIPSKSDVHKAFKTALSKFGDKFTTQLDTTIYNHMALVAISIIKDMIYDEMKRRVASLK